MEVVNISRNSAELKWAVPERNGGSAITNYIVEKRDVRRKGWQTVDTTVKELKCDVKPLNEGSLYVFRVAAENAVGVGPFCEMEDSVLAKDTFSKLERMRSRTNHFNLKAMKILTADLSKNDDNVSSFPGTPGPPYALAVSAVTKRYVDLQWEAPKNDGGRPILRLHFTILSHFILYPVCDIAQLKSRAT